MNSINLDLPTLAERLVAVGVRGTEGVVGLVLSGVAGVTGVTGVALLGGIWYILLLGGEFTDHNSPIFVWCYGFEMCFYESLRLFFVKVVLSWVCFMYIRIDYYRRQNYEQFVCLFSLINFIADVIVVGQAWPHLLWVHYESYSCYFSSGTLLHIT